MPKQKKPVSPLIQEYRKQRRRVQQFLRRAEKRGYQFDENVLPSTPKRITKKAVERLQKLTPEKLYKKSRYGGKATFGEVVKGTKGKELERKAAAQKAAETRKAREALRKQQPKETFELPYTHDVDVSEFEGYEPYPDETDYTEYYTPNEDTSFFDRVVISTYKARLNEYNEVAAERLKNWLNAVINQQGEHATAVMLAQAAEDGVLLDRKDSYSAAKVNEYISQMLNYLPEAGDFTKADIMESLEYDESYESPL